MDLESVKIDANLAFETGGRMEYDGGVFYVRYDEYPPFKRDVQKLIRRLGKGRRNGELDAIAFQEGIRPLVLKHLLVGWEDIENGGESVDFSHDAADELLLNGASHIVDDMRTFAAAHSNYFKELAGK